MANTVSIGMTGVLYRVKLKDCVANGLFDVSEVIDQKIVFRKNNGVTFEKDAIILEDAVNPGEFFIQYFNTSPEESILDLEGEWEFGAAGQLITLDVFETTQKSVFWVV